MRHSFFLGLAAVLLLSVSCRKESLTIVHVHHSVPFEVYVPVTNAQLRYLADTVIITYHGASSTLLLDAAMADSVARPLDSLPPRLSSHILQMLAVHAPDSLSLHRLISEVRFCRVFADSCRRGNVEVCLKPAPVGRFDADSVAFNAFNYLAVVAPAQCFNAGFFFLNVHADEPSISRFVALMNDPARLLRLTTAFNTSLY